MSRERFKGKNDIELVRDEESVEVKEISDSNLVDCCCAAPAATRKSIACFRRSSTTSTKEDDAVVEAGMLMLCGCCVECVSVREVSGFIGLFAPSLYCTVTTWGGGTVQRVVVFFRYSILWLVIPFYPN